jgi:hypothetical protein
VANSLTKENWLQVLHDLKIVENLPIWEDFIVKNFESMLQFLKEK